MDIVEPDWPAPPSIIAFTTLRTGGISEGRYSSLNLADHVSDDRDAVETNRGILADHLPSGIRINWLQQVHGNIAVSVDDVAGVTQADAGVSSTRGQACAVLTADCLPVLMCSRDGSVVAAAHAGWRGLLAGILENAVRAMMVPPGDILAWLGPAIGPSAFEVGPEVRQAFLAASRPEHLPATEACFVASSRSKKRYMADLYALAHLRLCGLGEANIFGGHDCTHSDSRRFFSFRRDGETGRMASVIAVRPR
ncbi:MAG: peptidoglycan editing factor PgeF [Pseudomonadota bacterium]